MNDFVHSIRSQFPILGLEVHGQTLVYLDNAATTQKPQQVIDAITNYYAETNSNVHRGVHTLSQRATDAFEACRTKLQEHLNAEHSHEIILTQGTTDSINMVANGFRELLQPGDRILVSELEHHSNLVPWQMSAQISGAALDYIPMTPEGALDMAVFEERLTDRTKVVAVNHISNALGTINPVEEIIAKAHAVGAAVLVDGAQALPHMAVDVRALGADFYAASAHKMYGPTGMGVLYGTETWLEQLPPYRGGGEMIAEVRMAESTYAGLPHKFEAGTPNIAGAVGWAAALDWMQGVGVDQIAAHEQDLLAYGQTLLEQIEGLTVHGPAHHRAAVFSFNVEGIHPYDLGTLLDQQGIAVRTGHHCAQPIMTCLKVDGTVRASLAAYNTREDLDRLAQGLQRAIQMLR